MGEGHTWESKQLHQETAREKRVMELQCKTRGNQGQATKVEGVLLEHISCRLGKELGTVSMGCL